MMPAPSAQRVVSSNLAAPTNRNRPHTGRYGGRLVLIVVDFVATKILEFHSCTASPSPTTFAQRKLDRRADPRRIGELHGLAKGVNENAVQEVERADVPLRR
jgi:hypothetical protein